MAWQEIKTESDLRFVKIKEHKVGDVLVEGKLVGSFPGKYRPNYKFEDPSTPGKFVAIGHKYLDEELSKLSPGTLVRISIVGEKMIKSGPNAGNLTPKFKIEVDND